MLLFTLLQIYNGFSVCCKRIFILSKAAFTASHTIDQKRSHENKDIECFFLSLSQIDMPKFAKKNF